MRLNRRVWRLFIVYAIYVIALSQIQVTLPNRLALFGQQPDLTLVLAILCGYLFGRIDGACAGLAAGFMRDMFAGRALGLGMLLLLYCGLLAALVFHNAFRRNLLLGIVQVLWLTVLYDFFVTGIVFLFPMLPDVTYPANRLFQQMFEQLPGRLLANGLVAIPLALLLFYLGPYRRQEPVRGHEQERKVSV